MSFQELLQELKDLNLPIKDYAVTSSAVMARHGLREAADIDIIVGSDLWEDLKAEYGEKVDDGFHYILIGNIEVLGEGSHFLDSSVVPIEEQLREAEVWEGVPFVQLEMVRAFKKKIGTKKALSDVSLIEDYLSSFTNSSNE